MIAFAKNLSVNISSASQTKSKHRKSLRQVRQREVMPMAKLRPIAISRRTNQNVGALIEAAAQLGSDGRGRNGLRGYMLYLARDCPVQFIALLAKVTRVALSNRLTRRSSRSRSRSNCGWSEERHIDVADSLVDAMERLGIDGKGRGGVVGYLRSLASIRPIQFMKLLSLLLDIQESEAYAPQNGCQTKRSLTTEEIRRMTLEEKRAKLNEMLMRTD